MCGQFSAMNGSELAWNAIEKNSAVSRALPAKVEAVGATHHAFICRSRLNTKMSITCPNA